MIVIDAPVGGERRGELREELRELRGTGAAAAAPPKSWIDLSPVFAIPLNDQIAGDAELANFIRAEKAKFRYDYVRLRCSFRPAGGETFEKAWLEVELKSSTPAGGHGPVAWSIHPVSEFETVEVQDSAKIGAALKFISAEAGGSTKRGVKVYLVRGYREGGPKPYWELRTTPDAKIDGSFAFHMVVRSPNAVETTGSLKLSTVIGTRKFLIFHSEQQHPDAPVERFVLPAEPPAGNAK